jgi:hypothetical protein
MFLPGAEGAEGPALARVVVPTLRHRIKLKFDWQESFFKIIKPNKTDPQHISMDAASQDALLIRLIEAFCLAAAPNEHEYGRIFAKEFSRVSQGGLF